MIAVWMSVSAALDVPHRATSHQVRNLSLKQLLCVIGEDELLIWNGQKSRVPFVLMSNRVELCCRYRTHASQLLLGISSAVQLMCAC